MHFTLRSFLCPLCKCVYNLCMMSSLRALQLRLLNAHSKNTKKLRKSIIQSKWTLKHSFDLFLSYTVNPENSFQNWHPRLNELI